jgi:hypothetical protein
MAHATAKKPSTSAGPAGGAAAAKASAPSSSSASVAVVGPNTEIVSFVRHHLLSLFVYFDISSTESYMLLSSLEKVDHNFTECVSIQQFAHMYCGIHHEECFVKLWTYFKPIMFPPVDDTDDYGTNSRPNTAARNRSTLPRPGNLQQQPHTQQSKQHHPQSKQSPQHSPQHSPRHGYPQQATGRPTTQAAEAEIGDEMVTYFDVLCFLLFLVVMPPDEKELAKIVYWFVFDKPKVPVTLEVCQVSCT